MALSPQIITEHGLSDSEYATILEILGREPTLTELGIFSVMWSEHCSYKSSRLFLKQFPTEAPQVLHGPGENAGVISIGDGLAVAFKMESHNHPSFIEPYQGAATGVGGILRDIFTMGARPVATCNSLHFGPLDRPKNRFLMRGVVSGIAGYGNCMGIPTVGGEVIFEECYNLNPIINVFSLGIVREKQIFLGKASGVGNPVIYAGSKTGRDGIHGATMASEEFDDTSEQRRPTVQVGDPFTEKCLLEACLELMQTDSLVAIQDMGAAGLTCSTVEMSSRGGVGMDIDLDKVPQREANMSCYDIMLSESQERMLIVARKGKESEVISFFEKWGLDASMIGEVIAEDRLIVRQGGEVVADIPASVLTDAAPLYNRKRRIPPRFKRRNVEPPTVPTTDSDVVEEIHSLFTDPAFLSKEWVFTQYDHMVRTNSVVRPGADAAVIRIKGSNKGLAITVDSNPTHCYLEPYRGAVNLLIESLSNITAVGAKPLGITDCLNFGSPETPHIMWEFTQTVKGLTYACKTLGIPVISGNVSFYNETLGKAIFPTPTIGLVGLIKDIDTVTLPWFAREGDRIMLVGSPAVHLGGSQFLHRIHHRLEGPLNKIELKKVKRINETLLTLIEQRLLRSLHDLGSGGLIIALLEAAMDARRGAKDVLGADIVLPQIAGFSPREILFGECPGRYLLTVSPEQQEQVRRLLKKKRIPHSELGRVSPQILKVNLASGKRWFDVPLAPIVREWRNKLAAIMER